MEVPAIVSEAEFEAVQRSLKARSPKMMPPMAVGGPTLLTGICFCACCGGAMTPRTGTSSVGREYRYYTCSTKARQGAKGCPGITVPLEDRKSVVWGKRVSVRVDLGGRRIIKKKKTKKRIIKQP